MHRIRKYLHVRPEFSGLDVFHLNGKACELHDHAHTFWSDDKGFNDTLSRLQKVDSSGRLHKEFL